MVVSMVDVDEDNGFWRYCVDCCDCSSEERAIVTSELCGCDCRQICEELEEDVFWDSDTEEEDFDTDYW